MRPPPQRLGSPPPPKLSTTTMTTMKKMEEWPEDGRAGSDVYSCFAVNLLRGFHEMRIAESTDTSWYQGCVNAASLAQVHSTYVPLHSLAMHVQ